MGFPVQNDSKGERTEEESTELGMTVTSGSETSQSVSASAGFSGWGFSAEFSGSTETRTFNTLETSTIKRVTDTYTCPPESAIFVYKRRYKLWCTAWIFYEEKNAWLESDRGKFEGEFVNEITANQELISPIDLTAYRKITNNPPSGLVIPTTGFNVDGRGIFWTLYVAILAQQYPCVQP
ncbi:hypothetical protein ANOM_009501 [Aspergillus nomiae NRRL 13137]|uniref:Uncharacterized protein n=1 Tax=Aspergillus nomiae NRRL (strain ATCC 15546 / NRRL 13137 / CBS 260.88 / M93) TaxID=1509407 RepID=A0A0L1IY42_ASPN3|nr:uncharacterized protein ANOM_009501 [Aspergillus nomiae NRRL 13137]KNG84340.1 hypothetical protein ANOM_009501 [Aspergillus nomiae NRRL 13137]